MTLITWEGGRAGERAWSLTDEAAQLLKLWLSLSGETEDASTTAAERYKTKALPLKHRPWGKQGGGEVRERGRSGTSGLLKNCTPGLVRGASGHLKGAGMRDLRSSLSVPPGGGGFPPAYTWHTQTPLTCPQDPQAALLVPSATSLSFKLLLILASSRFQPWQPTG